MIQAAKIIGTGLATTGLIGIGLGATDLIGAGVGIGANVGISAGFGALILGIIIVTWSSFDQKIIFSFSNWLENLNFKFYLQKIFLTLLLISGVKIIFLLYFKTDLHLSFFFILYCVVVNNIISKWDNIYDIFKLKNLNKLIYNLIILYSIRWAIFYFSQNSQEGLSTIILALIISNYDPADIFIFRLLSDSPDSAQSHNTTTASPNDFQNVEGAASQVNTPENEDQGNQSDHDSGISETSHVNQNPLQTGWEAESFPRNSRDSSMEPLEVSSNNMVPVQHPDPSLSIAEKVNFYEQEAQEQRDIASSFRENHINPLNSTLQTLDKNPKDWDRQDVKNIEWASDEYEDDQLNKNYLAKQLKDYLDTENAYLAQSRNTFKQLRLIAREDGSVELPVQPVYSGNSSSATDWYQGDRESILDIIAKLEANNPVSSQVSAPRTATGLVEQGESSTTNLSSKRRYPWDSDSESESKKKLKKKD